ncbi:MAG: sigma factor [Myxococcota bacterium]
MTPPSNSDLDSTTVQNALSGDSAALSRLCHHYQPQVLRIARQVAGRACSHDDAGELAQEVWCWLLDDTCRRLRTFDPERGSFGPFLRMVAWQQAWRIMSMWAGRQRRSREIAQQRGLPEPVSHGGTSSFEHRQLVYRIVDLAAPRLDQFDHILLRDMALGEAPVCELAPRLGSSAAALYKRRQRLRGKLAAAARRLVADDMARCCAARYRRAS